MNALDEIDAIRAAYVALEPLDEGGRNRAMTFLAAKLREAVAEPPRAKRPKWHHGPYPQQPIVDRVIERICKASGVTRGQLLGSTRKAEVCEARFAAMVAMRNSHLSMPAIGKALGGRDHTTILHGLKRAQEMRSSRRFQKMLNAASEGAAA